MTRKWIVFGAAATVIVVGIGVLANPSTWVFEHETPLQSSEAVETPLTAANLCEGTQGYATGGDPPWVRVGGSNLPSTPFVEARGQVLPDFTHRTNPFVTHTDAPFNHYSHDINVFLTLDEGYRHLLASGNFAPSVDPGEHGTIEIEWERGGIPMFAWPAAHDRLTVWGPHVWDCGHGDIGDPNDAAYTYRTEIHPPVGWVVYRNTSSILDRDEQPRPEKQTQSPWVWYESDDWQGTGATLPTTALVHTPVHATVADAFFSTFGGNVPSALNGCEDQTLVADDTRDATCYAAIATTSVDWAQPLLQQDYTFFVPAPQPQPAATATVVWSVEDRCNDVPDSPGNPPGDNVEDVTEADDTAEDIGAPGCKTNAAHVIPDHVVLVTENNQPGIRVTVKAATGGVTYPANSYLAYAKRFKVAWDYVPPEADRIQSYRVDFQTLHVDDDTDNVSDGEWVMSLRVNENWIHPLRGHGDDGAPFWENGAVGSGESYAIGESLRASPGPGQPLRIWVRGWDDDTSFAQDNDVNEVLPLINHYLYDLASIAPGSARNFTRAGSGGVGAYRVDYRVTNVTLPSPSPGTLTVGGPTYGPNADTGGMTRVSGLTPITLEGSDGQALEYRFFRLGSQTVSPWNFPVTWGISIAGVADARHAIQYAPISSAGIVAERRVFEVEVDTTPPSLSTPSDMTLDATSAAGRIVTWDVAAADSLPGPVSVSCLPASGSFFKIKHVTPVTCSAIDAVGNTTTNVFNVEVRSPFGYIPDFVALAREWIEIGSGVKVHSGNVGSFDQSAGVPTSPGFETVLGSASALTGGPQVASQSVKLQPQASAGDDYYVDHVQEGVGATHVPKIGYVPLFLDMPLFSAAAPGGPLQDGKDALILVPGHYGKLDVKPNVTLTLASAGEYTFTDVEMGVGARLRFASTGKALVRVSGRVRIAAGAAIGGDVPANRLLIYVGGSDGPGAVAFRSGNGARLDASVYAANGTLEIGPSTVATGTFLGRYVIIGPFTQLTLMGGAFDIIYP
jgi:hypothetical protein